MISPGEALALVAASSTFFAPYRAAARRVAAQMQPGRPLLDALDGALAQKPPIALRAGPLRFVPATALPPDEAYEAFIARTACVPTRENLHDLFNALVWLSFPALKRHLNELQAAQIAVAGIGATRGAARDALTLFDENGAFWAAPAPLAQALSQRDWRALFVDRRAACAAQPPVLFGHALLEKLLQPRKPITAHVWLLPQGVAPERHLVDTLNLQTLAPQALLPLPVLGVPGWWPANEAPAFYDDATVFRPRRVFDR